MDYDSLGVPGNPEFYSRTVVTSVAGTGNSVNKIHKILDVRKYSGKRVCIKFHGRTDAVKNIAIEGIQNFGSGGSASVFAISPQKVSLTTSFQKNVIFVDFPSVEAKTIGDLSNSAINFFFDAGSDFDTRTDTLGQQSGTFDLSEVEIYVSNTELPVRRRTRDEELKLCLPYFRKSYSSNISVGEITNNGAETSHSIDTYYLNSPTVRWGGNMVSNPTMTFYNPVTGTAGSIRNISDSTNLSGTVATYISETAFTHYGNNLLTASKIYQYHWTAKVEL